MPEPISVYFITKGYRVCVCDRCMCAYLKRQRGRIHCLIPEQIYVCVYLRLFIKIN